MGADLAAKSAGRDVGCFLSLALPPPELLCRARRSLFLAPWGWPDATTTKGVLSSSSSCMLPFQARLRALCDVEGSFGSGLAAMHPNCKGQQHLLQRPTD